MSQPNIPNIIPTISINREEVVNLLLASIALEELGLGHIINSEAEKIQFILGTIPGQPTPPPATIGDLITINRSVERTLRSVIKNQMLLQFKLEDVLQIPVDPTPAPTPVPTLPPTTPPPTTPAPVIAGEITLRCHEEVCTNARSPISGSVLNAVTGAPVAGQVVFLSSTGGEITPSQVVTGPSGFFTAVLNTPAVPGIITVTATSYYGMEVEAVSQAINVMQC